MTKKTVELEKEKVVRKITEIEADRLKSLITLFGKREKKLLYVSGVPKPGTCESFNALRINSLSKEITEDLEKTTLDSGRGFARAYSGEQSARVDEHSVLDLYLHVCDTIPAFQKACNRKAKKSGSYGVAKAAVAPVSYDGSEPPLKFDSPLFDRFEIKPSELYNALGFGATGAGKTFSMLIPLLNSMLAYRLNDGKTTSMLVIDPKVELLKT